MIGSGTDSKGDTRLTQACSLDVLANHLARLLPTLPPEQRPHASKLRSQILSWDRGGNRDGLRKEIARTIAEIEAA